MVMQEYILPTPSSYNIIYPSSQPSFLVKEKHPSHFKLHHIYCIFLLYCKLFPSNVLLFIFFFDDLAVNNSVFKLNKKSYLFPKTISHFDVGVKGQISKI